FCLIAKLEYSLLTATSRTKDEIESSLNPYSAVQLYDLCWARREPGAANALTRNVSKFFCYLALRSQRLRMPLLAPMPATAVRGTGPLRSLRKACALSCASSSTVEIRIELSSRLFTIRGSFGPDYRAVIISLLSTRRTSGAGVVVCRDQKCKRLITRELITHALKSSPIRLPKNRPAMKRLPAKSSRPSIPMALAI